MDNLKSINYLRLNNFRNYKHFEHDFSNACVFISGENGAGKTTLLESISLLIPGKGLKNADYSEMKHNFTNQWVIGAKINQDQINTGLINKNNIEKRIIKVNGEQIKKAIDLYEYINILWLTPQLEQSLLNGSASRRKLLDRLVFMFLPIHADLINIYEKKLQERSNILKIENYDNNWLNIIEKDLSILNFKIFKNRLDIINKVNSTISNINSNFPKIQISQECDLSNMCHKMILENTNDDNIINSINSKLYESRKKDFVSKRNNFGTHKTDLNILHIELNRLVQYCSTGEQKSIIISLILFNAYTKKNHTGESPIILFDEVMVHLDKNKQQYLIEEIKNLKTQVWVTDVTNNFWDIIDFNSQLFHLKNNNLHQ